VKLDVYLPCSAGELYAVTDGVRCTCRCVDDLCWLNGCRLCRYNLLLVGHIYPIYYLLDLEPKRERKRKRLTGFRAGELYN